MDYWNQGKELNGDKFIVEQLLGIGGFGFTYVVRQTRNNKLFALKILNLEAQSRSDFQQLQAKYFTEDLGNDVTLDAIEIPNGTLMMGSPENEKNRLASNNLQHQVTVPSFYIAKFPITQARGTKTLDQPNLISFEDYGKVNLSLNTLFQLVHRV